MPPTTPPQAVIAPRPWPRENRSPTGTPQAEFAKLFGPILGMKPRQRLHVRAQGNQYFMTTDPDDTLLFPTLHEYAGTERYDWYVVAEDSSLTMLAEPVQVESWADRPGTVKFGWLRDVQDIEGPTVEARTNFLRQVQDRDLKWKNLLADYQVLKAKPEDQRSEQEASDLEEIEAVIRGLAAEGPPRLPK